MIPKDCKRLAEVDFPIARVSRYAAEEKEARRGHIPKLHIWPAARPTAASRSMLLALLLPDPCDPGCPKAFKETARHLLSRISGHAGKTDVALRKALLEFIADFANAAHSTRSAFLDVARGLVSAVSPEEIQLVVDPFAGGGSIPLEALRLGCDAFASDLNPVACTILHTILCDIPGRSSSFQDELEEKADQVKQIVHRALSSFYPLDPSGHRPIAYIWARTVRCESPNCGAEIPLIRSFWLSRKGKRKWALRYSIGRMKGEPPNLMFKVFEPNSVQEIPSGTIHRANATCPCCNVTLAATRVRSQLINQKGGSEVLFNSKGKRIGGAILLAVVASQEDAVGRYYRVANPIDYGPVFAAQTIVQEAQVGKYPEEMIPVMSGTFNAPLYGMKTWGDLFTARQKIALTAFADAFRELEMSQECRRLLALCLDKMVDMNTALCVWQTHAQIPAHMLSRYAIPMGWDFAEAVPIADSSGSLKTALKRTIECLPNLLAVKHKGTVNLLDAAESPLPDESCHVWFTDPPYYNAIPYADLSDFFFVWLKRFLPGNPLLRDPFDKNNPLTPKARELCEMSGWDPDRYANKDKAFYEDGMARAFREGKRVLRGDGIGCIVFAHKTTEGWEALLSGMIRGGWVITGSWPIATEMASRLRARDSAALATSVHLVCRPRLKQAPIGDWGEVLRELPNRVGDWMGRLQAEGIRGADLVFACIGPALEIYSRYSKVVDPDEKEIPLGGDPEAKEPHKRGFLAFVWETVGRIALGQVLGTSEARARNGMAEALEEDARLTALFLWTLQSTDGQNGSALPAEASAQTSSESDEEKEEDISETDEEDATPKGKIKGYSLVFDVVRRFAQPLGIELPRWEGRIIETKKGVVRLIAVSERTKQLFGDDGADAVAELIEHDPVKNLQQVLFPEFEEEQAPKIHGRGRSRRNVILDPSTVEGDSMRAATTLDRVHVAMLLQAGGQSNALRALIKAEQERGPDFLRLANALSALYPKKSEEKRLLDAMLLAVQR